MSTNGVPSAEAQQQQQQQPDQEPAEKLEEGMGLDAAAPIQDVPSLRVRMSSNGMSAGGGGSPLLRGLLSRPNTGPALQVCVQCRSWWMSAAAVPRHCWARHCKEVVFFTVLPFSSYIEAP